MNKVVEVVIVVVVAVVVLKAVVEVVKNADDRLVSDRPAVVEIFSVLV